MFLNHNSSVQYTFIFSLSFNLPFSKYYFFETQFTTFEKRQIYLGLDNILESCLFSRRMIKNKITHVNRVLIPVNTGKY